jgi:predicted metalloendopeptidase
MRDKPQWQKCVEYVNDRMGMAVGELFIRDNFDEGSKKTVMLYNNMKVFCIYMSQSVLSLTLTLKLV